MNSDPTTVDPVALLMVLVALAAPSMAQEHVAAGIDHQGKIAGTVVSAVTGEPISNAYVGVGDFGDSGGSNYERHRADGLFASTKTDGQGHFEIAGLVHTDKHAQLDSHPLVITHPGFVPHRQSVALPSSTEPELKIALEPAATAVVTMVDMECNLLPGNWMIRLEALDGHRFIPAGRDPHLSAFSSNCWSTYIRSGTFNFTELRPGSYRVDAIAFVSPQSESSDRNRMKFPKVASAGTRYHGGEPSVELKAGEATKIAIKPQDNGTQLTIGLPEVPDMIRQRLPTIVGVSRDLGLLSLDDGKIRSVEDPQLGHMIEQMLFLGVAPDAKSFSIENLPPRDYAVFAGPPMLLRGAKVSLAPDGQAEVLLEWAEP